MSTAATVVALLAMGVGLAGTFVPVVPGLGLIWLAAVGHALLTGPGMSDALVLVPLTGLAVIGVVVGIRIPRSRAVRLGIPTLDQVIAVALAAGGAWLIPVVGAPLGFVGGVAGTRVTRGANLRDAVADATQITLSLLRAALIQFLLGTAMIVVWVIGRLAEWALTPA